MRAPNTPQEFDAVDTQSNQTYDIFGGDENIAKGKVDEIVSSLDKKLQNPSVDYVAIDYTGMLDDKVAVVKDILSQHNSDVLNKVIEIG